MIQNQHENRSLKPMTTAFEIEPLRLHNQNIKRRFLAMYRSANAGHVGCSLSCAELLTFIRFGWMKPNDEILLSKGHAAAVLYSLLAEDGTLSEAEIATFYQDGTLLSAHPPPAKLKGIRFATGSLGHGLSLAAGLSLGDKLKGSDAQVFCVTSDGELNEGTIWEAAMFAAHHKLTSLFWLIDRNRIQGFGKTEDVMQLEPLRQKLEAFGWKVAEADGHDFASLEQARQSLLLGPDTKPRVLICHTKKGHGMGDTEDTVGCHYLPLTIEQYERMMQSLDKPNA